MPGCVRERSLFKSQINRLPNLHTIEIFAEITDIHMGHRADSFKSVRHNIILACDADAKFIISNYVLYVWPVVAEAASCKLKGRGEKEIIIIIKKRITKSARKQF